jgi:hypothetical protein
MAPVDRKGIRRSFSDEGVDLAQRDRCGRGHCGSVEADMLKDLKPKQVQFVALLAKVARMQRDALLGHVPEDDLVELKAARGEHNPTAALGFVPVPPEPSQAMALREAVGWLSPQGRSELYALMRLGQGDLAVRDWERGLTEATTLADEAVMASITEDPDLHDHLMKGLYEAGLVS